MNWQNLSATLSIGVVSIATWEGVGMLIGSSSMSPVVKFAIKAVATIVVLLIHNAIALAINPSFFGGGGQVAVPPTPPTQQGTPPPAGAAAAAAGAPTTSGGTTSANLSVVPNVGMSGAGSHH